MSRRTSEGAAPLRPSFQILKKTRKLIASNYRRSNFRCRFEWPRGNPAGRHRFTHGALAGEPERLGRFLALTGIGPESIRAAAREPRFLLGVLDHLAGEEPLLLAFAAENAISPSAVMQARDTIAGRPWARDTP